MQSLVRRFHTGFSRLPFYLLVTDAVLFLLFFIWQNDAVGKVEVYWFTVALATGWLSFATGMASLWSLRNNTMAAGLGAIHGFLAGLAMMIDNLLWLDPWHTLPGLQKPTAAMLLLRGAALFLLGAGIYVSRTYLRRHSKTNDVE